MSSSAIMERYLMPARLQRQQLSSRTSADLDLKKKSKKTLNAVEWWNNLGTNTVQPYVTYVKVKELFH
jgi:hypothetical protein